MKQKLLLMVLVLGMSSICMAQLQKELEVGVDGYKWYKTRKDGKMGAEDINGNTIVPCDYAYVIYQGTFDDSNPKYFEVWDKSCNYFGIYYTNGRNIIPINRHYTFVHGYSDNGALFYCFEKKGIGNGICDVNGREVIFIEGIDFIFPYYNNYVNEKFYYLIEKNGMHGIADGNGKIIIQPQYKSPIIRSGDNFVNKDTGRDLVVGSLASVTTTHNPLIVGDNSTYTSSVSSSTTSTPTSSTKQDTDYGTNSKHGKIINRTSEKQGTIVVSKEWYEDGYYSIYLMDKCKACGGTGWIGYNLCTAGCAMGFLTLFTYYDPNGNEVERSGNMAVQNNSYYGGGAGGSYSGSSSGSSGSSGSSVYTKCTSCNGTGRCSSCNGRGYKFNSYSGHDDSCPSCRGKGSCPICYGRGKL